MLKLAIEQQQQPSMSEAKILEFLLKTCQYEYLIDSTESVWCKFFDDSTLNILEYQEDISSYCQFGYKHDISRLMTCDLVDDLVVKLRMMQKK
jgi:hypothetical protein